MAAPAFKLCTFTKLIKLYYYYFSKITQSYFRYDCHA